MRQNLSNKYKIFDFIQEMILSNIRSSLQYKLFIFVLLIIMGFGLFAYCIQFSNGLSSTSMSDIVSWGFYVANFTFFVGVAAASVMLILPAYVFKDKNLYKIVIIGEIIAVGALVVSLMFLFVDLGNPLKAWHLMPVIGAFNWPSSLLCWDVIVINGYLGLNLVVPFYILFCHFVGKLPNDRKYRPLIFISIFWAFAIHIVTAFLYEGLPARPFWNNPLMGPRFLASAFAAGTSLIALVLIIIKFRTDFKINSQIFDKLRMIIVMFAIINLIMLFSEVFKDFYSKTHHSDSAVYLFFGIGNHNSLVPWIWTAIAMNIIGTLILFIFPFLKYLKITIIGSILLFIGIWIEKSIGLVVPGFIPSPLGEVIDYVPTWIEVVISTGIVSFGVFVVSIILKPALLIEKRFESKLLLREVNEKL